MMCLVSSLKQCLSLLYFAIKSHRVSNEKNDRIASAPTIRSPVCASMIVLAEVLIMHEYSYLLAGLPFCCVLINEEVGTFGAVYIVSPRDFVD